MQMQTSLQADAVTVSRGGRVILRDVSLRLSSGEVILLRGQNGAGKTTLLRTLAGLIKPDAGELTCSTPDNDISDVFDPDLVAYCGPINAVKRALTVDENLDFWRNLYGAEASASLLAKTGLNLEPFGKYPAGALSTGFARRLGLARLMIADRPIWLIDEPTASLDENSANDFISLVRKHIRGGGAALIATHDQLSIPDARTMMITTGPET